jgi:uncharacterized protein (TIGR02391 family)
VATQEQHERFMRNFPAREQILEMEPEELGPFILRFLKKEGASGQLSRYNFSLNVLSQSVAERFMEAWAWLEREGFLAPKPGDTTGSWFFITRKGKKIEAEEDFEAYKQAALFPHDLDARLTRTVKPLFLRGDYDTAIFRAFKEVEVQVRKKSGFTREYGRPLMQRAFGPPGILVTGDGSNNDDQHAMRELFAGAISFCKNPSSHHEVQFENPREVIDLVCFANQLLRIVERLQVRD